MWIEIKHLLGTLQSPPTCVIPADVGKSKISLVAFSSSSSLGAQHLCIIHIVVVHLEKTKKS